MNYARIVNNVAVDVSRDPNNCFHPQLAADFVQVPDNVSHGWTLSNGTWAAPVVPEPVVTEIPVKYTKVSPVEFKLLFTSTERIAIQAAKATNLVVADFYSIVEDPRLTTVDFNLKSVRDAIAYLASVGLVEESRVAEIISGKIL